MDTNTTTDAPLHGPVFRIPCPGHNWDDPVAECSWEGLDELTIWCWRTRDSA